MSWDVDVVVVGGGPAGCSVARQIAGHGFKVLILEENKNIGEPVQCAGLVSPRTLQIVGCQMYFLNEIKGAHVYAPEGDFVEIKGSKTYAVAIDRSEFDRQIAYMAKESGAELLLEAKACGFSRCRRGVTIAFMRRGKIFNVDAKILIGADGVNSQVAKWAGLHLPVEKIKLFAAEVELVNSFSETVDIFLGNDIAPGWFGWVIPLDRKRARLGTGSIFYKRPIAEHVKRLLEKYPERFHGLKIKKGTGGFVPIGIMENCTSNIMLVGDAACQTKPISGGGLYLGIRGAEICAQVAVQALIQENFSKEFLSRYQIRWNREMGYEIKTALRHHQAYLKLTDFEISSLIRFFNKEYWKEQILNNGDIDYPSILSKKFASAPPWAEKFVFSCFRKIVFN